MNDAMKCFINQRDVSDRMKSHLPPLSLSLSLFHSIFLPESDGSVSSLSFLVCALAFSLTHSLFLSLPLSLSLTPSLFLSLPLSLKITLSARIRERERGKKGHREEGKREKQQREGGRERGKEKERERREVLLTSFALTFAFASISRRTHSLWPFSDE